MAIRKYEKNGEILWSAAVKVRSRIRQSLSVQKSQFGFTNERSAKTAERRLIEEATRELTEKESRGKSWARLCDDWETFMTYGDAITAPVQASTIQDYIGTVRKHTAAWFSRPASEISVSDIRVVLNEITNRGLNPVTVRKIRGFISNGFKWAIETGWDTTIRTNPALGIRMDRTHRSKRTDILTHTEIKKLLSDARTLKSPWYPVWAMAVMTGMRSGELFALEWNDIDWENRRISVNKSYSKRAKVMDAKRYPDGIKSTKSGESREVPINQELEAFLKEQRAESNGRQHVLPRIPAWVNSDQAQHIKAFCMGIGIRPVCFHALRACFATQLLQKGVAPVVVMAIAGWKDLKTMVRYIRLAGIDIQEGTAPLKVLSPKEELAKVFYLNQQV